MPTPDDQSVSVSSVQAQSPLPGSSASSSSSSPTLLDTLFIKHLISQQQYDQLKTQLATDTRPPEEVIIAAGVISEEKIAETKAQLLGIPFVSLDTTSFTPQVLSLINRDIAERFHLIPFLFDEQNQTISLAMSNPLDVEATTFITQKTGKQVKIYAAAPSEVEKAIGDQYRQEIVGEVGRAVEEISQFKPKEAVIDAQEIGAIIKDAPIAKIVSTILEYAVNSRSSDVHIEPLVSRVRVRYRIDGILYDKLTLPKSVQEAVISRIKILAELKLDEHRAPQDGRFNFKAGNQEVDLRIAVLPTVNGEKVVMRLLRKSGGIPTLNELGLGGVALKNLETSILRPHGIIIVCGPTGSGKTTTLYAVLSKLNTTRVNILSLEDPVEYEIPGVNQVQVNPGVGLSFASGLRAFLRQDPNVILVGEIRDQETTDLAVQAALTGHLIFSTLHTSNASGALPRLLDLGAESFLLASTINCIVGQRIVRKICPHCKEAYAPPAPLLADIKVTLGSLFTANDQTVQLYRGKGCMECGNTGYFGRVGIFEVLMVSQKMARLVLEHADANTVEKAAVAEGMITLKQDGYLKVLQGVTTMEEVLRVAQE